MYRVLGADQKEYGPISADQVREWIAQGRLNRESLASAEGAPGWKPLGNFPEFAGDLGGPTISGKVTPAPFSVGPTTPAVRSPPPGPAVASGQNSLAMISLVLGILALVFSCCCYGLPFNIGGIICGFIALSQLRATPGQSGRELATVGLVLSFLSIAIGAVFLVIGLAFNGAEILRNLKH